MNKNFTRTISCSTKRVRLGRIKVFALLILLQLVVSVAYAQSVKVTGTVTDSKGDPLPGVSVKVKGTAVGVSTANNGSYTLNAPNAGSVLVFSYIGYLKQEHVVGA